MMSNDNDDAAREIDIRKAYEILSSTRGGSNGSGQDHCDEGCHTNAPREAAQWGQRVDLDGPSSGTQQLQHEEESDAADATERISAEQKLEEERKRIQEERAKRAVELEEKFQSMSVPDLLGFILSTQQQRVASYQIYERCVVWLANFWICRCAFLGVAISCFECIHFFVGNRGLDDVLATANMTNYPNVCAEATASFSVLSETINCVKRTLASSHDRSDLAKMVRRLQSHEKEKLSLTAALHLEQIRTKNHEMGVVEDARSAKLLQEGVTALRAKLANCVKEINEALEEIRFELVEPSE
jgi:DNA repair REX1-B